MVMINVTIYRKYLFRDQDSVAVPLVEIALGSSTGQSDKALQIELFLGDLYFPDLPEWQRECPDLTTEEDILACFLAEAPR